MYFTESQKNSNSILHHTSTKTYVNIYIKIIMIIYYLNSRL